MSNNYFAYSQLLGKGAFGEVNLGLEKSTGKLVAIKSESKEGSDFLSNEADILKELDHKAVLYSDEKTRYLVTKLYGPSLYHLHKTLKKFTLKSSIMTAICALEIIKFVHGRGILHRDIKPGNFLIDYELPSININLIDFGLSKSCLVNGRHIPFLEKTSRVGNLRYMSKHVHRAVESSYRDDIYSIGYMIVCLAHGNLPWKLKGNERTLKDKHATILEMKLIKNADLTKKLHNDCKIAEYSFANTMLNFFTYADSLTFGQKPDYDALIDSFKLCLKYNGLTMDFIWDWSL